MHRLCYGIQKHKQSTGLLGDLILRKFGAVYNERTKDRLKASEAELHRSIWKDRQCQKFDYYCAGIYNRVYAGA